MLFDRAYIRSMMKLSSALLLLGLSASAEAATNDTITISGSVASTLDVACTDTAGATSLSLTGGADQIVKVSDCAISTNNDQGISLSITSGNLTKSGTSDVYAYQVTSVADAASAPVDTDFTVSSGSTYSATSSASGAFNRDVYIMFSGAAGNDPGTYSASLTVTVSDQ